METNRKAPNIYVVTVVAAAITWIVLSALGAQFTHIIVTLFIVCLVIGVWWYRVYGRSSSPSSTESEGR